MLVIIMNKRKYLVGVLSAIALGFNACSPTMKVKSVYQPLPPKIEESKEDLDTKYNTINNIMSKYRNPQEQCSFEDKKYLLKPHKIEIYDIDNETIEKETIEIPSEKEAWALSGVFKNINTNPDSVTDCMLTEGVNELYKKIINISTFYDKEKKYFTHGNVFAIGDNLFMILTPQPSKNGLYYVKISKEGKYIADMFVPLDEEAIKAVYKSDKTIGDILGVSLAGLSYTLVTNISAGWAAGVALPMGLRAYLLDHKESKSVEKLVNNIKADKITFSHEDAKEFYKEISQAYTLYAYPNNPQSIIAVKSRDHMLLYVGNDKLGVVSLKDGKVAFVKTQDAKGLTTEEKEVLGIIGGITTGYISKEVAEENAEKKDIYIEKQEQQPPSIGPGSGSDTGGSVINP